MSSRKRPFAVNEVIETWGTRGDGTSTPMETFTHTDLSLVTMRQSTAIERHEERTIWTESHLKEELRVTKWAHAEAENLHSVMLQTHTIDDVHVLQRGGLGISPELYTSMRLKRVRSFPEWLAFASLRHTCSEKCTCKTFLHWKTCKHACSLQIIVGPPEGPTPARLVRDNATSARAPAKTKRSEEAVWQGHWQGALGDVTNRREEKKTKIKKE